MAKVEVVQRATGESQEVAIEAVVSLVKGVGGSPPCTLLRSLWAGFKGGVPIGGGKGMMLLPAPYPHQHSILKSCFLSPLPLFLPSLPLSLSFSPPPPPPLLPPPPPFSLPPSLSFLPPLPAPFLPPSPPGFLPPSLLFLPPPQPWKLIIALLTTIMAIISPVGAAIDQLAEDALRDQVAASERKLHVAHWTTYRPTKFSEWPELSICALPDEALLPGSFPELRNRVHRSGNQMLSMLTLISSGGEN